MIVKDLEVNIVAYFKESQHMSGYQTQYKLFLVRCYGGVKNMSLLTDGVSFL